MKTKIAKRKGVSKRYINLNTPNGVMRTECISVVRYNHKIKR